MRRRETDDSSEMAEKLSILGSDEEASDDDAIDYQTESYHISDLFENGAASE
jgi:hypothetical protein